MVVAGRARNAYRYSMPKSPIVVLVTGASSGIGKGCSEKFFQAGYRVYAASRSAVGSTEGTKGGIIPLRMDVTATDSVRDGVDCVLRQEGRLDVVVNSAGMGIAGAVEDTSIEEAWEQFEVNLLGTLRMCNMALPAMRKQRSGYIINIGSIAGLMAIPYQGLYSASKFALEGLTEALRLEVGGLGIRVVLIEPGDHKTRFTENRRFTSRSAVSPVYQGAFARAIQRMADDEQQGPGPEQVAKLVYKVVNTAHPRLRYTSGPRLQRAAVLLKRLAPYSFIERILKLYYNS